MNEKQKDTNSGAQQKLKEETTQLLSAVEEVEKELEKSYRTLAEEPKENGEMLIWTRRFKRRSTA